MTGDTFRRPSEISEQRRALLEQRLRRPFRDTGNRITPRDEDGPVPLSFAQQRLWFLDRLMPGSAFYNVYTALQLTLPLNIPAVERSINEIVGRHEILRTAFQVIGDHPAQVILPSLTMPLRVVDLRAFAPVTRPVEAQRLANEEAQHPFDLSRPPLIRTTLLQLGEQDYVLLITMHHIVSDGWSIGIFFRELTSLYEAMLFGRRPALPMLECQYADYALWQRRWLRGDVLEAQVAYWNNKLGNLPGTAASN